ncbi:alpha-N-acetylgalactosaminidase-like [Drosophila obscura]|uniref:alpha-N-acetylgalactosaminidase-like n=1 Tax=Drosophila obscura TaxID=7282 RepID=UPI000BA09E67|nr:alpha-N-acetylgalactosaminidase-like [Drosophila obscura]
MPSRERPSHLLLLLICYCSALRYIHGLENGLAQTPPMGWMPYERFQCTIDCARFPRDCISESLFKRTADLLVSEGYAAVGFQYLIIDDCWMETLRDSITQRLLPARERFPSGMADLSDYIHRRGLKFGIYHDVGEKTCMFLGPGARGHFQLDAQTFADWGVDYVKLDGCYATESERDRGYPAFGKAMNSTGRTMVYSCSWPFYKEKPDYRLIAQHCNLWRFAEDITDSYTSVFKTMEHYRRNQQLLSAHAGPGRWNDPDMLVLGNFRLSYDASRLQLAIWSVIAAPLIMTNDLETVRPEIRELLQNREVIAINQDLLGMPGRCVLTSKYFQVWLRRVTPVNDLGKHSFAVAFVNLGGFDHCPLCPRTIEVGLERLGLDSLTGYYVVDLFNSSRSLGMFKPYDAFSTRINPEGVTFYKFTVVPVY